MPSDDKSNSFDHCHRRNDDRGTFPISGYDNKAFRQDGDPLADIISKPPLQPEEEPVPKGKFKMSRKEKWRILKNIATISFAFMIQFTSFQGTANLQSSINAKDGLGTSSLSAVYAALVISCIFVPTFLIKRLTVKWTLCFSLFCYAPYIASQLYPRFYTLIPAGILVGLGAAPMWAAQATYLTQAAAVYAKLTDQPVDGIVVRFFGFFFLAWQTAELWGNLISSLGKELPILLKRNILSWSKVYILCTTKERTDVINTSSIDITDASVCQKRKRPPWCLLQSTTSVLSFLKHMEVLLEL